jgi:hypothetical protein
MRYFLLSWDCHGLECLQDITEFHPDSWDKNQLMGLEVARVLKRHFGVDN